MAALSSWTVSINLVTRSNFGLVGRQMAGEANALNSRLNTVGRSANSSANAFSRVQQVGVAAFNAVGVAAAAATVIGVKGAGDVQQAMAQASIAMGLNMQQMERFHGIALKMSQATAQSVSDSMNVLSVMAQSGLNRPDQLAALAMPIAQFADTQYLGQHHIAFEDSAAQASMVAHLMGAYDAKSMAPILDTLFKMSNQMPDAINKAVTQLGYYATDYRGANVSAQTILNLAAEADRLGLGRGKGGTGLDMIERSILKPSAAQEKAQARLGVRQYFKDGTFDVEGLFAHLASISGGVGTAQRQAFQEEIDLAFPANSARIAAAFGSGKGVDMYRSIVDQQKHMENLPHAQARLMETMNSQLKLLNTNLHSLLTEVFYPFLKPLTTGIGTLAGAVGNLATYFHDHQDVAKVVGTSAAAWGVAALANFFRNPGAFIGGFLSAAGGAALSAGTMTAAIAAGLSIFAASTILPQVAGRAVGQALDQLIHGTHRQDTGGDRGAPQERFTAAAFLADFRMRVFDIGHAIGAFTLNLATTVHGELKVLEGAWSGLWTTLTSAAKAGATGVMQHGLLPGLQAAWSVIKAAGSSLVMQLVSGIMGAAGSVTSLGGQLLHSLIAGWQSGSTPAISTAGVGAGAGVQVHVHVHNH